jgi:hypothetical protein
LSCGACAPGDAGACAIDVSLAAIASPVIASCVVGLACAP